MSDQESDQEESNQEESDTEEQPPATELVLSEKTFDSFGLNEKIVDTLVRRMELTRATRIQAAAIPVLLGPRDVFLKAETGSGKTLAYAIPLVQHLGTLAEPIKRTDGLRAIVVAPTRELCQQIYGVLRRLLSTFINVVPGVIVGGQKKKSEKACIRRGINVLVAAPGRLVDHVQTTSSLVLARVMWLVLDEADRLLDMGFQRSLSVLVSALDRAAGAARGERRNVLVSATLSEQVRRLAYFSLRNPTYVDPSGEADAREALTRSTVELPPALEQRYCLVEMKERLSALAGFLRGKALAGCRVIVFFSSIDAVEFHHSLLVRAKLQYLFTGHREEEPDVALIPAPLFKLHGDLTQIERSSVYEKFCGSSNGIIFCTDVASRGIDLPNVHWIVQYDPPGDVSDYIHRVGRTARIGNSGNALLFLLPSQVHYVALLQGKQIKIEPESLGAFLDPFSSDIKQRKKLADLAHFHQLHFEQLVLGDAQLAELARKGFVSFTRAYSTHTRETAGIFVVDKLHLGHVAKSFALREAPTKLRQNMIRDKTPAVRKGRFKNAVGASRLVDRVRARPAEDTRRRKPGGDSSTEKGMKRKKKIDAGPRTPITAHQGKKRAMSLVMSEFSAGSVAPPAKRQKEDTGDT
jgi:ATP-dependent RNA helicase DDX31/DBP7